jgi:hypothetical protein
MDREGRCGPSTVLHPRVRGGGGENRQTSAKLRRSGWVSTCKRDDARREFACRQVPAEKVQTLRALIS